MSASTVPAAKQAILARLVAVPALNLVQVTWAPPTEQEDLQNEMVYFDDPVIRRPNWGPLGGAGINEEYVITLRVQNRTVGDDWAGTETRAWELVALVEAALRLDLRLGGVLWTPLNFDEQEYRTAQLSDGFYGEITIPLVCTARI